MKLIKVTFKTPQTLGKVEFTFSDGINEKTFVFKEKYNWPMIQGQPLDKVEIWLRKTYLNDINFATFGALEI